MGAVIRAGLEGIRARLATPPIVDGDPTLMSASELSRLGLVRLPETLDAALKAFEADKTVSGWFEPTFRTAFTAVKRMELRLVEGMDGETLCARYAEVY
jgi:glutamine synthetase